MNDTEFTQLYEKVQKALEKLSADGWGDCALYCAFEVALGLNEKQAVMFVKLATGYMQNAPGSGNSRRAHRNITN